MRTLEIILARHGPPDLRLAAWDWITPRQIQALGEAYEQADVIVSGIPGETLQLAGRAGVVVSSTRRRCVQSAQALSANRPFLTDGVYCEPDIPSWSWAFPKLPLVIWGVVLRLAWFAGVPANAESRAQTTTRARHAAQQLAALAREHGSVFLMGHGLMTAYIAQHLLAAGWSGRKRPLLSEYWECSVYRMSG